MPPKKKKKIRSLEKRRSRAGWFFVMPFIIGLVVVYLPLIFDSIYYSFTTKITVRGVSEFTFTGFENYYEALFATQDFGKVLMAGLGQLALQIPAILMFSLFMAVILNQKMVGRAAFRAILFIPVILSTGLMEMLAVDESMNAMNIATPITMTTTFTQVSFLENSVSLSQSNWGFLAFFSSIQLMMMLSPKKAIPAPTRIVQPLCGVMKPITRQTIPRTRI